MLEPLQFAIDITPQAPPGSSGLLKVAGYFFFVMQLSGVCALVFAGGKFGWEKFRGQDLESPKIIVGAAVGGVVMAAAGSIMSAVSS